MKSDPYTRLAALALLLIPLTVACGPVAASRADGENRLADDQTPFVKQFARGGRDYNLTAAACNGSNRGG